MKLDASDIADLRPLIAEAVRVTLQQIESAEAKTSGRLGFTEPEGAAMIGVQRHVLRDCRLRGEIHARKVGSRYVYSREALLAFLADDGGRR
jgi:hypothetical protein